MHVFRRLRSLVVLASLLALTVGPQAEAQTPTPTPLPPGVSPNASCIAGFRVVPEVQPSQSWTCQGGAQCKPPVPVANTLYNLALGTGGSARSAPANTFAYACDRFPTTAQCTSGFTAVGGSSPYCYSQSPKCPSIGTTPMTLLIYSLPSTLVISPGEVSTEWVHYRCQAPAAPPPPQPPVSTNGVIPAGLWVQTPLCSSGSCT